MNTLLSLEDLAVLKGPQIKQLLLERMANSEVAQRRFWQKVTVTNPDQCWLWKGSLTADGYGLMIVEITKALRFNVRMHRFSYFLKHRCLPDEIQVLHKCDVRACVNPDHLFPGNNAINMADMVQKGRQPRGERNGRHKLTDEQILQARSLRKKYIVTFCALAEMFGVSYFAMRYAVIGKHWRHLPLPEGVEDPML